MVPNTCCDLHLLIRISLQLHYQMQLNIASSFFKSSLSTFTKRLIIFNKRK